MKKLLFLVFKITIFCINRIGALELIFFAKNHDSAFFAKNHDSAFFAFFTFFDSYIDHLSHMLIVSKGFLLKLRETSQDDANDQNDRFSK